MRNVLKAETLERRFPLLSVENGCIVSKDADLTVAFEVELPELYTVTADEYEAMHSSWIKAVKVLPEHSVVCKQDWFVKETYRPKTDDGEQSFLTRSYELHFNERPYLNHKCYLFHRLKKAGGSILVGYLFGQQESPAKGIEVTLPAAAFAGCLRQEQVAFVIQVRSFIEMQL